MMTLDLTGIKVFWLEQSSVVDQTFMRGAVDYANQCSSEGLHGTPEEVYKTQFNCVVYTRNRMLLACADALLADVDASVKDLDAYQQWAEGLITSVECLNYLVTH